jgi:hypothetical protein
LFSQVAASNMGSIKSIPDHDSNRVPAANLLLSILQNSGLEIDRFGSSTGALSDLESKPDPSFL